MDNSFGDSEAAGRRGEGATGTGAGGRRSDDDRGVKVTFASEEAVEVVHDEGTDHLVEETAGALQPV